MIFNNLKILPDDAQNFLPTKRRSCYFRLIRNKNHKFSKDGFLARTAALGIKINFALQLKQDRDVLREEVLL